MKLTKNQKRLTSILCALILAGNNICPALKDITFSAVKSQANDIEEAEITIGDFTYSYTAGSFLATLKKYNGTTQIADIVIPTTISITGSGAGTYSLIEIADDAFKNSYIDSIDLSNTFITTIGKSAFEGCQSLETVKLPSTVRTIGESAFRYCSKLTNINFPKNLTSLGAYAFQYCYYLSLGNTLRLAETGLTEIKTGTFESCKMLYVELPNTLKNIESRAFYNIRLNKVTLPDSVIFVGKEAFAENYMTELVLSKNLTTIGEGAFKGNDFTEITIPGTAITIQEEAFANCVNLKDIILQEGVGTVKAGAFSGATSGVKVYVPDSVYSIVSASSGLSASFPTNATIYGLSNSYIQTQSSNEKVNATE